MKELSTIGISGLTNQQLFSLLDASVTSVNLFKQRLINTQLSNTSNSINDLNNLFNSY